MDDWRTVAALGEGHPPRISIISEWLHNDLPTSTATSKPAEVVT
jgi:hypothetical protein